MSVGLDVGGYELKKVLVLAYGNRIRPSLRYRIVYPLDILVKKKRLAYRLISVYSLRTERILNSNDTILKILTVLFDVVCFLFKIVSTSLYSYDVIIIKNFIFPLGDDFTEKLMLILLRNKAVIYDLDDAEYLNPSRSQNAKFARFRQMNKKVAFWVHRADRVILSNSIIKNDLEQLYGLEDKKTITFLTVPFAYQYFSKQEDIYEIKKENIGTPGVIWLGSPHTQEELVVFSDVIKKIITEIKNVKIYILGTSKEWNGIKANEHIKFITWNDENEKKYMRKSMFGLNPLRNDSFQKRKSAFKVIQYYRAGIFPIVSDVGINKSLVEKYGGFCVSNDQVLDEMIVCMKGVILLKKKEFMKRIEKTSKLTIEYDSVAKWWGQIDEMK